MRDRVILGLLFLAVALPSGALRQSRERDLAAGAIPRADSEPGTVHPCIGPTRTIPRAEVLGG